MRLIDADALRERHCEGCSKDVIESCIGDAVCATMLWVDESPTVDAIPVVRCKDCEHYVLHALACRNEHMNGVINIDGFCSYGKRKNT